LFGCSLHLDNNFPQALDSGVVVVSCQLIFSDINQQKIASAIGSFISSSGARFWSCSWLLFFVLWRFQSHWRAACSADSKLPRLALCSCSTNRVLDLSAMRLMADPPSVAGRLASKHGNAGASLRPICVCCTSVAGHNGTCMPGFLLCARSPPLLMPSSSSTSRNNSNLRCAAEMQLLGSIRRRLSSVPAYPNFFLNGRRR